MIKATINEGNVQMTVSGDMPTITAEALCFIRAFYANLKKSGKKNAATTFRTMVLNDSDIWEDEDEEPKEPSLDEQLRDELEKLLGEMAKLFEREDKKND